jgi:hypothetical protein
MGGRLARTLAIAAVLASMVAAAALAASLDKVRIQAGNLIVVGEGGFSPTTLPRDVDAPIELFGKGHIETADGSLPPILKTIQFEFDKHGSVDTTGLPVCTGSKLQATTVAAARKLCPGSIVGEGTGRALVVFPEQDPIPISSPITLFNGPRVGGDPTVFAHAYVTVPVPVALIVRIRIETIHNGRYGYRVHAEIPKIANGAGIPIAGSLRVGRKWTYKGVRHSYVNARCADGRLQAVGEFAFKDETRLKGTFIRPCEARD